MEQDVIELAAVLCRERGMIAGAAADLRGPGVGAGGVAEHGQGELRRVGLGCVLIEEERNGFETGAVDGTDLRHGSAQFASQLEGVELAAAGLHQVAHIEENECGQAEGEDRRGQHELAGKVQGIEDKQDSIRLGRAGHFALEHVDGDAGVF